MGSRKKWTFLPLHFQLTAPTKLKILELLDINTGRDHCLAQSGSIPLPHSRPAPVKSEFVRRCGAGAGKKLVTFTETMASRPPMPSDVAFPISGHGRSSHAFGTRQPVRAQQAPKLERRPKWARSHHRRCEQWHNTAHWQGGVLHNTSNTSMSRALKLIMLCMKGRHACAAPETRAAQGVMHTAGAHKLHTAAQTTSIHISFASSIFSCNDSEVVVEPSLQSRYEEILDRFSLGKNLRARARARTQTHGAKPTLRAEPSRAGFFVVVRRGRLCWGL